MFFYQAHVMRYFFQNFLTLGNLFFVIILDLFIRSIVVFILVIDWLTIFVIYVSILIFPSMKPIIFEEEIIITEKEAGFVFSFHILIKSLGLMGVFFGHSRK